MEKKNIYIGIFVIALIVCVLSPFLASGDPDGLEASAEHINPKALEAQQVIEPIMPDYTLPGMEDNPLVGVVCLIVGAVLTVCLAYGVFKLVSKNK
ncbi:MAG: PDGLE domain-containing protein [Methanosphaera sp.]|nr:PDGLE domain-containing protein [Methanosphaera sp.]